MVKSIKNIEKALGDTAYKYTLEMTKARSAARSFVVKDIEKNKLFTEDNIKSIRPGYGLPPNYIDIVLGKKAKKNIEKGIPLSWGLIS